MSSVFSDSLLLPAIVVAVLGWLTPKFWARLLPEGVRPLVLNALLSVLTLFFLTASFFAALYAWQGAPLDQFADAGLASNLGFFGRLGLMSAIIWAPIMILSLAGLPRRWTKAVW